MTAVETAVAGRTALVEVDGLRVRFPLPRTLADVVAGRPAAAVHAVDGVDLTVARGETLGLVGESGCGKTTLGRAILGLVAPDEGEVRFDGETVHALRADRAMRFRRRAQMVFQDPFSSLNPRLRVGEAIAEVLRMHRIVPSGSERQRVDELLERVGLRALSGAKLPRAFSGGERQRVVIARALALKPEFLVADEPVSALDVSVQAQVLNLLRRLKAEMDLTMVFISHDLAVVRYVADRIAVMYLGRVIEIGTRAEVFDTPRHPYTMALLRSIPSLTAKPFEPAVEGDPPSPIHVPKGCRFASRCPFVRDLCRAEDPPAHPVSTTHRVACHFADQIAAAGGLPR